MRLHHFPESSAFRIFLLSVLLSSLVVRCTNGTNGSTPTLTDEQLDSFQREGYLYIPQFLTSSSEEMASFARLVQAGDALVQRASTTGSSNNTFSTLEAGVIFGVKNAICSVAANGESECDETAQQQQIVQAFRDTALRSSKLVEACAELMQLDPLTQNMRVLRDVFLAKPIQGEKICDWHVDDQSFWPESFLSTLGPQQPSISSKNIDQAQQYRSSGINVWIAMDDMPAQYGGSMAVSRGSHTASWRHDAYRAIGQNRSTDVNPSKEEMVEIFAAGPPKNNTCNMPESDPELRKRIEATKVVFDVRKGDVLFADRLLFHRTVAMSEEGKEHFRRLSKDNLKRYSIRYVPGSARLPSGFNVEASILSNVKNEGRTLNEVAINDDNDGAVWYPQVWPTLDDRIDEQLDVMGKTLYAESRALQAAAVAEIFGKMRATSSQSMSTTE